MTLWNSRGKIPSPGFMTALGMANTFIVLLHQLLSIVHKRQESQRVRLRVCVSVCLGGRGHFHLSPPPPPPPAQELTNSSLHVTNICHNSFKEVIPRKAWNTFEQLYLPSGTSTLNLHLNSFTSTANFTIPGGRRSWDWAALCRVENFLEKFPPKLRKWNKMCSGQGLFSPEAAIYLGQSPTLHRCVYF